MLGQLLQQRVVVVVDSDPDGYETQGVARVGVVGRFQDGERVGCVDVGHAVGHQDHVVVGVRTLVPDLGGKPHAEVQPGLYVGAAVWLQPGYGADRPVVAGVRGFYGVPVYDVIGEVHHAYAIVGSQALPDALRCLSGDVHAVAAGHGPGGVEHQRHVQGPVDDQLRGLEGDAGQPFPLVQRVGEQVAGYREFVGTGWRVVLVVECVEPLLGPH